MPSPSWNAWNTTSYEPTPDPRSPTRSADRAPVRCRWGTFVTAGTAADERQWRRQQSVRWDERRLTADAEYGHAVKVLAHRYLRIAVFRGIATGSAPLEPTDELLGELGEAESHRSALSEGLWLLGDAATNAATVRVNHSLWHLEWLARALIPADAGAWDTAFAEHRTARQEYLALVRASLDLPSAETRPDVPWPPPWRTPPDPAGRHPGS